MNDQKICSKAPFPLGAVFWGTAGIALLACSIVFHSVHFALGAVPPLALAAGFWLCRKRSFEAQLTETGLRVAGAPAEIPYDSIQSLTMAGVAQDPFHEHPKAGALMVIHRDGVLQVPARLNVPVVELYQQLLARVPMTTGGAVASPLASYLEEERSKFGDERVWAFQGRRNLGRRPSTLRGQVCCLMLVAAGIVWIALASILPSGKIDPPEPWIVNGIVLVIVGFVVWLCLFFGQRHPNSGIRKRDQASVVIGPSGLAMTQGNTKGRMRWEELRDVHLSTGTQSFRFGGDLGPAGIRLVVEGAQIVVADIYDRPLPLIYGRIRRYWQTHLQQQRATE